MAFDSLTDEQIKTLLDEHYPGSKKGLSLIAHGFIKGIKEIGPLQRANSLVSDGLNLYCKFLLESLDSRAYSEHVYHGIILPDSIEHRVLVFNKNFSPYPEDRLQLYDFSSNRWYL